MDIIKNITLINAGAGSGKTFTVTEALYSEILNNGIRPDAVFATTFTRKAAQELVQRVRQKFIEKAASEPKARILALQMNSARINTLHALCANYLQRFAFELGISPDVQIIEEVAANHLFAQAMDSIDKAKHMQLNAFGKKFKNQRSRQQDSSDTPFSLVERVVKEAIANDIKPNQLQQMAQQSWNYYVSILDALGHHEDSSLSIERFQQELEHSISQAMQSYQTKSPPAWLKGLERVCKYNTVRTSWSEWEKYHDDIPQKLADVFSDFNTLQKKLGAVPAFRQDIKAYIELVYTCAMDVYLNYQALKKAQGVLDFADLEAQFLALLDMPTPKRVLRDEIQLLVVDEFQDTNPMQLAIYLKLVALGPKAIFVGDLKQAIYGFRGADPALMQELEQAIREGGQVAPPLDTSRRSTQGIVDFCNEVFKPVFGQEATLKCLPALRWQPEGDIPAVAQIAAGKNAQEKYAIIANHVKALKQQALQVPDKKTNTLRSIDWQDIAVLCKSNGDVKELVKQISASGVPVKASQSGLLEQPEIVLVLALLKLLHNRHDTLAAAEAHSILQNLSVKDWLEHRLEQCATAAKQGEQYCTFDLGSMVVEKLESLQLQNLINNLESLLQCLISEFSVPDLIVHWSDEEYESEQRLGNLDALVELAARYQSDTAQRALPVTITGFLVYLRQAEKMSEDLQQASDGNAVSVMTVHRSKGLEWPVVITEFTSKDISERLFGVTVDSAAQTIDLDAPLASRNVLFLPHYNGVGKGLLYQKIRENTHGQHAFHETQQEAQRLIYVGYTRARNFLFIVRGKAEKELSFINALPLGVVSNTINVLPFLKLSDATSASHKSRLPWVFGIKKASIPARLNPSSAVASPDKISVFIKEPYAKPFKIPTEVQGAEFGNAVHLLLSWAIINKTTPEQVDSKAQAILKPLLPAAALNQIATRVSDQVVAFVLWLTQNYQYDSAWVEYPIAVRNADGQTIQGSIDLLLESKEGVFVIDHKISKAAQNGLDIASLNESTTEALVTQAAINAVQQYSGQVALYRDALSLAGKNVRGVALNLLAAGVMVEV